MTRLRCGFDFGTSNSTIGLADGGPARLVPLEGNAETLPTAVFYGETAHQVSYGRAAMGDYLAGEPGRLMRSIKSVLGTSLMDETTSVGQRRLHFAAIIADFIREVKRRAEIVLGAEIDTVVQGRPVRFVEDSEAADSKAQDALAHALKSCGIRHVKFQYEPVAAARHWEATSSGEALALVADIGGGTSDFSLIRLQPRHQDRLDRSGDVLGNYGIRLGGTDFDRMLSLRRVMPELGMGRKLLVKNLDAPVWIYTRLATWSQINTLYAPKSMRDIRWAINHSDDPAFDRLDTVVHQHLGHRIAGDVEQGKIDLSVGGQATIDLDYIEQDLRLPVTGRDLEEAIAAGLQRLAGAVDECLSRAGVSPADVELLILTGGSTEIPMVRDVISERISQAKVVSCNTFGAVGLGLAQEAASLR